MLNMDRERRIESLRQPDEASRRLMYEFGGSEENLTREDIREYVEMVITEYENMKEESPDEALTIIIRGLSDDNLMMSVPLEGFDEYDLHKDSPEIKAALEMMRRAVIEELSNHLEPKDFLLFEKRYKRKKKKKGPGVEINPNYIEEAVGHAGEKKIMRSLDMVVDEAGYAEARGEALRKYAEIPDNKHLVSAETHDTTMGESQYKVVTKYEDLDNLYNLVEKVGIPFREALAILLDNMKGAQVLVDNDLMLEDIRMKNLGYDKSAKAGKLYDLDGLQLLGYKRRHAMQHYDYIPPELYQFAADGHSSTAKEMVYQFGRCLEEVLTNYFSKDMDPEIFGRSNVLIGKMKNSDPELRNELDDSITHLEEIIGDIEDEK